MYYSQHGEDKLIEQFFPKNYQGVCIEVGAYDGIGGSNTYHFEKKGWRCLCIEPNPQAFEKCSQIRKECYNSCIGKDDKENVEFTIFHLDTGESAISSLEPDWRLIESHSHLIKTVSKCNVEVRSLNSLLDDLDYPTDIDFISIDTENTELDVLRGIDLNKYNVKLLVIENNFNEPGCEDYLKQYNYRKVFRLAVNDFFLKK